MKFTFHSSRRGRLPNPDTLWRWHLIQKQKRANEFEDFLKGVTILSAEEARELTRQAREEAARKRAMKIQTAEFLLWVLLPSEIREAAIGDTNERFEIMVEEFGFGKARFWYWTEVAKSAWPLACYLAKQIGKLFGLGALAEFLRRAL